MDLEPLVGHMLETNTTELTINPEDLLTHPLVVIYLILLVPVSLFGSLGNGLILASILMVKDLRTVGNMFIFNLAIADMAVTLFANIFNIVGAFTGEKWFLDNMMLCDAIVIVCMVACGASLYNITLVSINRYVHICKSASYDKIFSVRNTLIMCILIWIVSFINIELPNLVGIGGHRYEPKAFYCTFDRIVNYYWSVTVSVAIFGIPLAITTWCYVKIYLHVVASKKRVAAGAQPNPKDGGKQKATGPADRNNSTKLAKTLFIIFIVFVLCWASWSTILVADPFDMVPWELYLISVFTAHGSSSINWLLYGLTNRQFRKAYFRILRIDKCCPQAVGSEESTTGGVRSVVTKETSAISSVN